MKKLLIFGTGGGAKLAYEKILEKNDIDIYGFVEFKKFYKKKYLNKPVFMFEKINSQYYKNFLVFIHKNFNNLNEDRTKIYKKFKKMKFKFYSYIHPSLKYKNIKFGENCFILENQSICSDVKIGNNVVMWTHNHIGDRTEIKDNVWISSSVTIGGDCMIEKNCFLGMNSTISHGVKIKENNLIGANALISKNTHKNQVFITESTKPAKVNSKEFVKKFQFDE